MKRAVSMIVPRLITRSLGKDEWRSATWVRMSTGLVTVSTMAFGEVRSTSAMISRMMALLIFTSVSRVWPGLMFAPAVTTTMSLPLASSKSPTTSRGFCA